MSLLRSIQRSLQCAAALDSASVNPALGFLYPSAESLESCGLAPPHIPFGYQSITSKKRQSRSSFSPPSLPFSSQSAFLPENIFIRALVEAGTCRQHSTKLRTSLKKPNPSYTLLRCKPITSYRPYSTAAPASDFDGSHDPGYYNPDLDQIQDETIRELKKLVLIYDIDPEDHKLVTPIKVKTSVDPEIHLQRIDQDNEASGADYLGELIDNADASNDDIFAVYQILADQYGLSLSRALIDKLLKRLSRVTHEGQTQMIRYFTVLDYLKHRNFPLTTLQWNNAIRFASRTNRGRDDSGLDSAMYLWKQMEEDAGVSASYSTFNILIHAAMLGRRWALAEKLIQEMEDRGHKPDRYFHHTRITYYGLRYGPSAVRVAYNQYVDGGFVVATDILNTVIRSFISSGELAAAEHVFERMKLMKEKFPDSGYFPHEYRRSRRFFQKLDDLNKLTEMTSEERKLAQSTVPIGPNLHTYAILIKGHALNHGNLHRVLELVDEMKVDGLQPNIPIFYNLMKAFRLHAHRVDQGWTADKLEALWLGFFRSAAAGRMEDLSMSGPLSYVLVVAFFKCCGRDRALEVLHEVQSRWPIEERTLGMIWKQLNRE